MGPGATRLVLELLECDDPVISAAAADDLKGAVDELVKAGLLEPVGFGLAITGENDEPVSVTWSEDHNAYGYFSPTRGWVTVPGKSLTRYRLNIGEVILATLGSIAGTGRVDVIKQVAPVAWSAGDVRVPGRTKRVPVWFVRRACDREAWNKVLAELSAKPAASVRIILTSTERARLPEEIPGGNRLISISDVAGDDGLLIDATILARRLDHIDAAPNPDELLVVSADGHEVSFYGETFRFNKGDKQRRIVRHLDGRYRRGEPKVAVASVIAELGLRERARIRDYFKRRPDKVMERLLFEKDGMCGFRFR